MSNIPDECAPAVPVPAVTAPHRPRADDGFLWVGADDEASPPPDVDALNREWQALLAAEGERLDRPLTAGEEARLVCPARDELKALHASRVAKNAALARSRAIMALPGDGDVDDALVDALVQNVPDFGMMDIGVHRMEKLDGVVRDVEDRGTAARVGLELARAVIVLDRAGVSDDAIRTLAAYSGLLALVASCPDTIQTILACEDVASWVRAEGYDEFLEPVPEDFVLPSVEEIREALADDAPPGETGSDETDSDEENMAELPEDVARMAWEDAPHVPARDARHVLEEDEEASGDEESEDEASEPKKPEAKKRKKRDDWDPEHIDSIVRIYTKRFGARWFDRIGNKAEHTGHAVQQRQVVEEHKALGVSRTTASVRSRVVRLAHEYAEKYKHADPTVVATD